VTDLTSAHAKGIREGGQPILARCARRHLLFRGRCCLPIGSCGLLRFPERQDERTPSRFDQRSNCREVHPLHILLPDSAQDQLLVEVEDSGCGGLILLTPLLQSEGVGWWCSFGAKAPSFRCECGHACGLCALVEFRELNRLRLWQQASNQSNPLAEADILLWEFGFWIWRHTSGFVVSVTPSVPGSTNSARTTDCAKVHTGSGSGAGAGAGRFGTIFARGALAAPSDGKLDRNSTSGSVPAALLSSSRTTSSSITPRLPSS
jgi:hypothetical protein